MKEMLEAGCTRRQIARELGVHESTVTHSLRLGYRAQQRRGRIYDWDAIRSFYEAGHSARECRERFGFSVGAWDHAVAGGAIVPRGGSTQHRHVTREAVAQLLEQGMKQADIAKTLALSKSTVAFHVRSLGIPPDARFNRRYDWSDVQRAIEKDGLGRDQCRARFGFSKHAWYAAVKRGDITPTPCVVSIEDLLVAGRRRGRRHIKTRLLRAGLKENRCEICGINEWLGKPLSLELHHVNGDGTDNRLENLQLLCGNCHAQTDNWGGRGVRRNGARRPDAVRAEEPAGSVLHPDRSPPGA